MLRSVLICVMLFSTASLQANSILVLGDSLSSAFGFAKNQGWVYQLEEKIIAMSANDTSWEVVNASIAGETSAGGVARISTLLDKHQPDLCILALGANDGLRGLDLQQLRANLRTMIEACRQYGDVVLLGMRLPPNYGKAYTNAFAMVYSSLAADYDLAFVPFFIDGVTENHNLMQTDNLHPNAAAQPFILDNIWPTVREKLLAQKVDIKHQ